MGPFLSLISTIAMRIPWESLLLRPRDEAKALEAFAASQMVATGPPVRLEGASVRAEAVQEAATPPVRLASRSCPPRRKPSTSSKRSLGKQLYKLELGLSGS